MLLDRDQILHAPALQSWWKAQFIHIWADKLWHENNEEMMWSVCWTLPEVPQKCNEMKYGYFVVLSTIHAENHEHRWVLKTRVKWPWMWLKHVLLKDLHSVSEVRLLVHTSCSSAHRYRTISLFSYTTWCWNSPGYSHVFEVCRKNKENEKWFCYRCLY